MKVVTTDEMRQLEEQCVKDGVSLSELMEKAGAAFAARVLEVMGTGALRRIVILVGPGNNGGDGLVAARHLTKGGHLVSAYLLGDRKKDDNMLVKALENGVKQYRQIEDKELEKLKELLGGADLVIDAIFGIGQDRPLEGFYKQAAQLVNDSKTGKETQMVIALDVPSGINADSGAAGDRCIYADYTITLGLPKIGLYQSEGSVAAGQIITADIGITKNTIDSVCGELITSRLVRTLLPKRPNLAHKGIFGKALVVAGSINYSGAARLACTAAARSGAGLVTLAAPASLNSLMAVGMDEVTHLPLVDEDGYISPPAAPEVAKQAGDYDALLIGCGLSRKEQVKKFIASFMKEYQSVAIKTVIDADALNILAEIDNWWLQLPHNAILTPHSGEMARLVKLSRDEVQQDRIGLTRQKAKEWNKTIVLKGANTVIASPDGCWRVNRAANAALATAGTGDVLAGIITGLLVQGLSLFKAATLGVYLHTAVGSMASDKMGNTGIIAGDLLPLLPFAIKELREGFE
jgi:hydroxyethylthiazole kinase-like uncharacterized protein yjeF